jgi:16S rRNA (adenine1518-N6/adenine1519-N6)-dimethyltransferase
MFQKEVAERIVARPGGKHYGRLSVIVQWLCEVRVLFDVPARAFTPPPKVMSSIVDLVPRPQPLDIAHMPTLERVTAVTFGQRRKMLRTSLKKLCPDSLTLLKVAGLPPTARPEQVSVAGFCSLARALDAGIGSGATG